MGAVILKDESVLLIRRGQPPLKGFWSLPGGVLEAGELLEEAVHREVLEETGLEVEPVAVVEVFQRIMRDRSGRPEYHYVIVDYLCEVTGGNLQAASDVDNAEWVRRDDFPNYRMTDGAAAVIEKGFRKHALLT